MEHGDTCWVARNVIDADNFRHYIFQVGPTSIQIGSPASRLTNGTLQIDKGSTVKMFCWEAECAADRGSLEHGLRAGSVARLELDLADGKSAGPFDIPLGGLVSALTKCGPPPATQPQLEPHPNIRFEDLNPEQEVNPQPRRR